jgi:MFS family permease
MTGYQWTVLFAAWLGWGFDAFDALLFNYVSGLCVPDLLDIPLGTVEAKQAAIFWNGALTSVLLVGWALGGIGFGKLADRIGRSRTLMLTILVYSLGTAACAFAPNLWVLGIFRFITSLGIGGEWAAGAAMVAEVVPEKKRLEAAALLYSAAPAGIFAAGFLSEQVINHWLPDNASAWRYVFLAGLLPALFALVVRHFVHEPEAWKQEEGQASRATFSELFRPGMRRRTFSGTSMAISALLPWWSCNAFLPLVVSAFAEEAAAARGLSGEAALALVVSSKSQAIHVFNAGGLLGTFCGVPLARHLGRKPTFAIYFLVSALAIFGAFGLSLELPLRLALLFVVGVTTYGALGSFCYYLPELYPTHLRGTGSGFCYNVGRLITAAGPLVVATLASQGSEGAEAVRSVMPMVAVIPLGALLLMPWVIETRDSVVSGK